jgi:hypothetical protein
MRRRDGDEEVALTLELEGASVAARRWLRLSKHNSKEVETRPSLQSDRRRQLVGK